MQEFLFDRNVIEPTFTSFERGSEEEPTLELLVVEKESRNSPNSENNSGNANQEEVTLVGIKRTLLISGKVEKEKDYHSTQ